MNKPDIKSMTLNELADVLAPLELPSYRTKQLYSWLQQKGAASFSEMSNLPAALRDKLSESFELRSCEIVRKQVSALDGTVKYLFRLFDGELIEAVLLKYKYGNSLCVSSQVGCKMGCSFCATGMGGFVRDLSASEMLSQLHAAQADSAARVSHVVLMGMGEPLDNFNNVCRFLSLVSAPDGNNLGMRNISLSTCGIIPKIHELERLRLGLTLSVSLHAPNDEIRSSLMPVNKKYPISDLLCACRSYAKATSRRISFEYAMINGVNDSADCAAQLVSRLHDILCHVNLIPANEVRENSFKSSNAKALERFSDILASGGVNVTVRRTLGADIDASCGQLRGKEIGSQQSPSDVSF